MVKAVQMHALSGLPFDPREALFAKLRERQSPRLRLSMLGSKCLRQVCYASTREPVDPTADRYFVKMGLGTAWDAHILPRQAYWGHGVMAHSQVTAIEPVTGIAIVGHADLVLYMVSREGDWFAMRPLAVVDVKTIGSYSWRHRPDEKHFSQVNGYAFCLGAPRWAIAYYNADTGADDWIWGDTDSERARTELAQLAEVHAHNKAGTLPPRGHDSPDSFPCGWRGGSCGYRSICWDEADKELADWR